MSSLFRIDPERRAAGAAEAPAKWTRLGLSANPFPESGVLGDVIYSAHMPDVVNKITQWLNDIAHKRVGEARGPFALEGTIGAGKTHLLSHMEKALVEYPTTTGVIVIRENLVNAGGGRLLLSTLFGGNLKLGEIAEGVLKAPSAALKRAIEKLPSASPLRPVMNVDVSPDTLALWLRGATLTRTQSQSIGGRTLDAEGERLRAVIHLLRLAAQLNQVGLVVLLLDQLEDLERKAEVSPLRRARFLTDLRIFIDEGLEGAPIALCMAWNTEGAQFMRSLNAQYPALASRISTRVTVPALPQGHLVPFAQEYLNHVYKNRKQRGLVFDAKVAAILTSSLTLLPGGDVPPREWLDQLRKWAEREAQKHQ